MFSWKKVKEAIEDSNSTEEQIIALLKNTNIYSLGGYRAGTPTREGPLTAFHNAKPNLIKLLLNQYPDILYDVVGYFAFHGNEEIIDTLSKFQGFSYEQLAINAILGLNELEAKTLVNGKQYSMIDLQSDYSKKTFMILSAMAHDAKIDKIVGTVALHVYTALCSDKRGHAGTEGAELLIKSGRFKAINQILNVIARKDILKDYLVANLKDQGPDIFHSYIRFSDEKNHDFDYIKLKYIDPIENERIIANIIMNLYREQNYVENEESNIDVNIFSSDNIYNFANSLTESDTINNIDFTNFASNI